MNKNKSRCSIRIDEIDAGSFYKVFKTRFLSVIIMLIVTATILVASIWAHANTEIQTIVLLIVNMFFAVVVCKSLFILFKITKRSNWFLAISDEAIYIKYRSYLYEHYPKCDKQIVSIKPSEITAFRETYITDIIWKGQSKSRKCRLYLDIIVPAGLSLLQSALANEHRNYGLGKERKSKLEISRLDYPVIISQENIIRIDITRITPGTNFLVAELRNLGIEELKASNKEFDFTKQGPLNNIIEPPSDIIRERVVELLKAGRRLDARDAIQFGFRISRKQTNNMIEELVQEHVLK